MSQTVVKLHLTPAQASWQDRLAQLRRRIRTAWWDAVTQRELAVLDDRALGDIGVSRAQAQFVAERPVWELVPGLYR